MVKILQSDGGGVRNGEGLVYRPLSVKYFWSRTFVLWRENRQNGRAWTPSKRRRKNVYVQKEEIV